MKPLDLRLRAEEVSDEEVIAAIRSVPCHHSAHRARSDGSIAPWQIQDPASGNITAGAGLLEGFSYDGAFLLKETNATTPEIRTLPDPINGYMLLTLSLLAKNGQNLVIRCSTPIWLGATATQPALTQNGQFITFTAVNQSIVLRAVPCTKISYVGTQSTFVNVSGFRWMVDACDGPTVT